MSAGTLRRKGWRENPRQQGLANFLVAVLVVIFGTLIGLIVKGCDIFSEGYLLMASIFLGWGLLSLVWGLIKSVIDRR